LVISILQKIIDYSIYALVLISPLLCFKVFTHPSMVPKTIFIEVVGGLILICWVISLNLQKDRKVVLSPLVPPACVLIVVLIFSLLRSDYLYGGIFELLNVIVFFLLYLLVINYFESHMKMDRILIASTITGTIVSIIGISQYYGFSLININLPQDHPPGATFYYKNMAAQYIIMIIPLSFYLLMAGKRDWIRVYSFFSGVTMITFLYCSGSRASSVGLLSGMIVTGILHALTGGSKLKVSKRGRFRINRMHLSRLLFFLVLIYLLLNIPGYIKKVSSDPAKIGSAKTRVSLWVNTIEMIKDNPILGVGLGAWKVKYPLYHNAVIVTKRFTEHEQPLRAHNEYLQLTAETGIVGLIISLWMIFIIFRMLWRICRYEEDKDARLKGIFFTMSLSALLVNALFSFPFRLPVSSFFFILILGMLTVLYLNLHGSQDLKPKSRHGGKIVRLMSVIIISFVLFVIFLNVNRLRAEINYYHAQRYTAEGDIRIALLKMENARELYPYDYRIRLFCGILYQRVGRYDEAIKENLAALRLRPHDTSAHNNLGIAYFSKGEYEKAIKEYEAKLRILPDSLGTLKNLAKVYIQVGELSKAEEVYKRALSYYPDDAFLHFIVGAVYAKKGRLENAVREMKEAVRLDPDNEVYRVNLKGLLHSIEVELP
jgi:tetratricopeptide (TPR) repeat protein